MIFKLQRKTLVKSQIIGYAITLFVGVLISLITVQLFFDTKPLLKQESDVFDGHMAVISKQVSILNSLNKGGIYFSDKEIERLKSQPFTKNISLFNSATFKINARAGASGNVPKFYTDLFFESIPDEYVDVKTEDWKWEESLDFLPIVIPESYLKLYNFGFAESQGLPVLSKGVISELGFSVQISGNGKSKIFKSRIVGFSNKINSILVPKAFLNWANNIYGRAEQAKTNRLLIEFNNPSDDEILKYFNENNYSINKEKLEFSKLTFFYKSALGFVFFIAIVIIILSVAFILLSINLIIQKNKKIMVNLYNIGYSYKEIAKFYQVVIFITTITSIILSVITAYYLRSLYIVKLKTLFNFDNPTIILSYLGIIFIVLLIAIYNMILMRNIKKVVL